MSVSSGSHRGGSLEARELGAALKRLRDARGLNTRQLGEMIGVTSPNFTHWERGDRLIPANRLLAVLDALNPDDAERERLLGLHRQASGPGELVAGPPSVGHQLVQLIEYEQAASDIVDVAPQMIPGLLQTEGYAAAVFGALPDTATKVALRIGRQKVITRPRDPATYTAYIGSEALVAPVAPVDVMAEQLQHLLAMQQRDNITIQVVSNTQPGYNPMRAGQFMLLEFPAAPAIVHLESHQTAAFVWDDADVRSYFAAVKQIGQIAMTPARTAEVIAELVNGLEKTT